MNLRQLLLGSTVAASALAILAQPAAAAPWKRGFVVREYGFAFRYGGRAESAETDPAADCVHGSAMHFADEAEMRRTLEEQPWRSKQEIDYIVKDCGAKVFITTPKCYEQVKGLVGQKDGPLLYMMDEPEPGFRSYDKEAGAQPVTPIADEVAGYDMLYSSGTTGRPKGIKKDFEGKRIDEPNAFLKVLCADMCGMNADSIYLSPAPLYHAAPLRFNMMVTASANSESAVA